MKDLNIAVTATPGETFEQYVDRWAAIKREAKRLADAEMAMRKAILASVKAHCGQDFKEGANTIDLGEGRKLTVTHKINRTLAKDQIEPVREKYNALNDRPVPFDDLLKIEYSLVVSSFRKLDGAAGAVFSDLVTSKEGSPEIVIK